MSIVLDLVERACPVCGSHDQAHVSTEMNLDPARLDEFSFASRKLPEYMHYRLVECPVCDLLYASPAPTAEWLVQSYGGADYDSAGEARLAAATYEGIVRTCLGRLPDRDGAIDIGAGDGAFLERLLLLGFTSVLGFEPSVAPIETAREDLQPLIRNAPFTSEGLGIGRYSLITCFQTIEHLDDPFGVCGEAHALLKEGGALVLVCHDRRALSARLLGRKSPIFDIEHLQLFSRQNIHALLERVGFRDVKTWSITNRYELRYWARLAPLPRSLKVPFLRGLGGNHLGAVQVPVRAGNLAAVGYKRNSITSATSASTGVEALVD